MICMSEILGKLSHADDASYEWVRGGAAPEMPSVSLRWAGIRHLCDFAVPHHGRH